MGQKNLFTILKSLIFGSWYILCPSGLSKAQLYKNGSRIPVTKDPLMQSQFR